MKRFCNDMNTVFKVEMTLQICKTQLHDVQLFDFQTKTYVLLQTLTPNVTARATTLFYLTFHTTFVQIRFKIVWLQQTLMIKTLPHIVDILRAS